MRDHDQNVVPVTRAIDPMTRAVAKTPRTFGRLGRLRAG